MADSAPTEILPEKGLVYSELKELQPVLCRPKLLPIKSYSLERLERMEKKIAADAKARRDAEKALRNVAAWNTAPTPKPTQTSTPAAAPATPPAAAVTPALSAPNSGSGNAAPAPPQASAPSEEDPL